MLRQFILVSTICTIQLCRYSNIHHKTNYFFKSHDEKNKRDDLISIFACTQYNLATRTRTFLTNYIKLWTNDAWRCNWWFRNILRKYFWKKLLSAPYFRFYFALASMTLSLCWWLMVIVVQQYSIQNSSCVRTIFDL